MDLEESIEIIEDKLDMFINDLLDVYKYSEVRPFQRAVERVLDELNNSVSKNKIQKLMYEVHTDHGLGSELSKRERLGAIEALEELLEDKILKEE